MPITQPIAEARCATALSTQADTRRAIQDVCRQARRALGSDADLAIVFSSHHHGPDFGPIPLNILEATGAGCVMGCTGESIVGTGQEIEEQPALSLWLARLPGVTIHPIRLEHQRSADGDSFLGWPDDLVADWPEQASLMMLGEPFSFPMDILLARLNEEYPGTTIVGGMASGAWQPNENRLFLNRNEYGWGAVGVLLEGSIRVRTVVSQGCRPIGRHYVITKSRHNVIEELGGQPPLELLRDLVPTLSPKEQELLNSGLHVGRVISEYQDQFSRGDFLVRNVIGADQQSGAIAIGDLVRPGQTVQFHLRDRETADEDLRELLTGLRGGSFSGGLLFTCNGRGQRLFGQPHHDAATIQEFLGDVPLAGFFAQGEIGPIGGKNFLHGFTASLALFENTPRGK